MVFYLRGVRLRGDLIAVGEEDGDLVAVVKTGETRARSQYRCAGAARDPRSIHPICADYRTFGSEIPQNCHAVQP